ncbi:hypothetical protein [Nocardia sp. NPDC020380]
MSERDWHAWHAEYDRPGTHLAQRLEAVQEQIRPRWMPPGRDRCG